MTKTHNIKIGIFDSGLGGLTVLKSLRTRFGSQVSFVYLGDLAHLPYGEKSEKNPWKANSLEWHTPEMPPVHGNFGKELPVVYRWPYDFSVPGIDREFIPQHVAPSEVPTAKVEKT